MDFVNVSIDKEIATVRISRGSVNAFIDAVVQQLKETFTDLEKDPEIRAVILTGKGPFFSFGFDVPEFLSYSKEEFADYLKDFTDLLLYLFLFPKPVVAALNGHTMAGGCQQ